MKANIHPQYFEDVTVVCSCGSTFTTGSTKQSIRVDLCSMCHPFYTGTQKLIDTEGKVNKFARKREEAQKIREKLAAKTQAESKQKEARPSSLADMVAAIRKQQKSS